MADARIRKAWRIAVHGYSDTTIAFAPTASRARAEAIDKIRDAWSMSWRDSLEQIQSVRRAPERDILLPKRHPLAATLHPEILHCVVHAYGGTGLNAGWRDYFYTSADDWHLKAGLYHGLFNIHSREHGHHGKSDMITYELTALGRNVARGEAETYPRW